MHKKGQRERRENQFKGNTKRSSNKSSILPSSNLTFCRHPHSLGSQQQHTGSTRRGMISTISSLCQLLSQGSRHSFHRRGAHVLRRWHEPEEDELEEDEDEDEDEDDEEEEEEEEDE